MANYSGPNTKNAAEIVFLERHALFPYLTIEAVTTFIFIYM
jgi:hypothetical protein